MTHGKFISALVGFWVVTHSLTFAHPGHSHHHTAAESPTNPTYERTWSTSDGEQSEQGSLVTVRDGRVQIRRPDDSLVFIPLAELTPSDREFAEQRLQKIRAAVEPPVLLAQATPRDALGTAAKTAPPIAAHFAPFVAQQAIRTRWDDRFFWVESRGIPAHPMMVGIRAWQQQVPIPQNYVGDNAWQIPLHPVPAKTPASAKNRFLRGAIAVAVNGIPIFNPLNNRGDDAFLFGELDEYGGHCGRADDYHYHLPPIHLEKTVGKGKPIAYALDGYPIYGYQERSAADYAALDALNGHRDAEGHYHYHSTKTYPYLNGGFYGEVVERDGQVDPQPRAEPLRPSLPPLRGARIVAFDETEKGSYRLTYEINNRRGTVSYRLAANGTATFEFVDPQGKQTTETYSPRRRGPAGPPPGQRENPRPPRGERRPERTPPPQNEDQGSSPNSSSTPRLTLSSTSVDAQGKLSIACTCDGRGESPAVAWRDAPPGTRSFAISLWHTAPDQEKSYWLIYNIPAHSTGLTQDGRVAGTLGLNDRRRAEYDPMCSQGPGIKTYHLTVWALDSEIDLAASQATRRNLLGAVQGKVLAAGTLDFTYERKKP